MNQIIVSVTSYPKRIATIAQVIESIVHQTILPDRIILYLSEEQFETKEIVPDLEKYRPYGFEVRWCKEDLGPHKKYFYAMQEFSDDIIITIDDDVIYRETMIEELVTGHKKFPNAIISRKAHLISWTEKGVIAPYLEWYVECMRYINEPRMDLVAIGYAGILYPPHVLPQEVFNKESILAYCRYADDLWLKVMETINNVSTVFVQSSFDDDVMEIYIESSLYSTYNAKGGNDIQFQNLLNKYNECMGRDDTLVTRLQQEDSMFSSDVEREKNIDLVNIISNMMADIEKCKGVLIYGAGYFANVLYNVMKHYKVQNKVEAFIVEKKENNPNAIDNIPVREYKDFMNSDESVIIALSHEKQDIVCNSLIDEGFTAERMHELNNITLNALFIVNETIFDSAKYWNQRYSEGGNSGAGSYNRLADYKAMIINNFIKENNIREVIEWGCGDGNQLSFAHYPQYVGFDVSQKAIEICREKFKDDNTKEFIWCGGENFKNDRVSELVLSLDVIYHLIEDDVYEEYMRRLFDSSRKYVCIYSSNFEKQMEKHVKCRRFSDWINANLDNKWELIGSVKNKYPYLEDDPENTTFSDFYFYERKGK